MEQSKIIDTLETYHYAAEEEHCLGEEGDRRNLATLGGQGEALPRDRPVEGEERRLEEAA